MKKGREKSKDNNIIFYYDDNHKLRCFSNIKNKIKNKIKEKIKKNVRNKKIKKQIKEQTNDKSINILINKCEENNVYEKPIKKSKHKKSEEEIIETIGGADKTDGSCVSLALAYVGNKAGYDVLSFRGGKSREIFSRARIKLLDVKGIKAYGEKHTSDFVATRKLLKNMKYNKEYILFTGHHAAVIRGTKERGLEYLELQTKNYNGWHKLNVDSLNIRFSAQKTHTVKYIGKVEATSVLIDAESLYNHKGFHKLLGYINTDPEKQLKG